MVFIILFSPQGYVMRNKNEHFAVCLMCGVLQEHIEGTVYPVSGRSNQSILKEVSPEYSLEGLMLKLKLQYLAT